MTTSRKVDGASLVAARMKQGLTQAQLAREVGLSPAQLCHIERGRRQPDQGITDRLAAILGVDTETVTRPAEIPDVLTVSEAAKALRVHPHTVLRWLETGQLEGTKPGRSWRIPARAVAAILTPAERAS